MTKQKSLVDKAIDFSDSGEYHKIIELLPDNVLDKEKKGELYFYRGWAHHKLNDNNNASRFFESANLLAPDLKRKFIQLGIDYYDKNEFIKAIEQYEKALALDNNYAIAHYNRALAYYDLKEYDQSLAGCNTAILLDPDYTNAYIVRGLSLYYKNNFPGAIDDYNKAVELNENNSIAYFNRGLAWYSLSDFKKAIDDYNKAIILDNDYVNAYFNRALAFYYIGDYDKAIEDYDRVILAQPDYADAYLNRGLAWNYKAKYDKAIADYNEVLSRKSEYKGHAYINRGIAYYYKGQYNKAIEDYTSAIKINEKTGFVYNNRGLAWFNKGFYNEAIADYNIALQLKPDYPDACINRAMVWYENDEYNKSIEDCTKALELNKNSADAYNIRGSSWFNLREFDKAVEDFIKVTEFIGFQAIGNTNLGDVSSAKGDFLKAKEYYELAEKDINIPDWLKIPLKQKKDRNNQRLSLLKSNVPVEELIKQVHIEERTEKLLQKIKKISKSDARNVVHYTKIFVADIYVSSLSSKMHYSNAIYMNDPMEGKVIFDYLNDRKIIDAYTEGEKRYESSVYLGSFLPAEDESKGKSYEDELVMWRTYGKDENGNEAAGCNLVLNSDFFRQEKKQEVRDFSGLNANDEQYKLAAVKEDHSMKGAVDEELLNVIYIDFYNGEGQIKNDPSGNLKPAMEELKILLTRMVELRDASVKKEESDEKANRHKNSKNEFSKYIENMIFKQLSAISFLFKSADYIYENEVRVIKTVPRDSELIKAREVNMPGTPRKRFYIESNNEILPFIQRIYLGPKVENHQQWSLFLDFEIRQRAKDLAGMKIPPYELFPSQIEILKSSCKFQ